MTTPPDDGPLGAESKKNSSLIIFKSVELGDAPELSSVGESRAKQVIEVFRPMSEMLAEFEERFCGVVTEAEDGITKSVTTKAKALRIAISKVRIAAEKARREQKEEYLRAGKAIDGVSNILKWAVTDKENRLKEIEDHFETLERERLESLQIERVQAISQYLADAHERELSGMADDVWQAYFNTKKNDYESRLAAEQKAEEERIAQEKAQAEEQERVRLENERLKAEAAERDKKTAEEKEANEKKLTAEREARERAEAEVRAKETAEIAARENEEARIQADLSKGDTAKSIDLVNDLEALKGKYQFTADSNKSMFGRICLLLDNVITVIKNECDIR